MRCVRLKISMSTSRRNKEIAVTKAYYEKYAGEWAEKRTDSFHHEKEFTGLVSLLRKGASVIDIGCASGIHVPLFLGIGRGLRYEGLDIARSFLKIASRRYPQLTFSAGNIADQTSLPKKRYDAFMAVAVLMHIPKDLWDEAFGNIERTIRPRGYGYITLPIDSTSNDLKDVRHFTIIPEKEQKAYLRSRGWKILQTTTKLGSNGRPIWKGYIVQLP